MRVLEGGIRGIVIVNPSYDENNLIMFDFVCNFILSITCY